MKISKLFHWLYATLMFLPLIALPIFGIYSHRHTIDSGTLQVPQNQIVDFNQLSIINDFEYVDINESQTFDLNENITFYYDNVYLIQVTQSSTFTNVARNIPILNDGSTWFDFGSISTYIEGNYVLSGSYDVNLQLGNYYAIFKINEEHSGLLFYWVNGADIENQYYHVNLYNLTQMFGSGNEPTYSDFLSYYPLKDYAYTLSRKEIIYDYSTITYDDTDIMSQFTYQIYNLADNYLNFDNVFGFINIYNWLQFNIFNGTPSIYFTMFWHLLTYWLIVSLFWLVFDVLMYVPRLAHRWLDRGAIE